MKKHKKLSFERETIRRLTAQEATHVNGGRPPRESEPADTGSNTYGGCTYTQLATGCTITSFGSCNATCSC